MIQSGNGIEALRRVGEQCQGCLDARSASPPTRCAQDVAREEGVLGMPPRREEQEEEGRRRAYQESL